LGGLLNAALLLYALILSPSILAQGVGQDYFGALMTTTIIVTIIFTFANGVYARVPFAQSVYMGENAFFAFGLVRGWHPLPNRAWHRVLGWRPVLYYQR